jgi:hypothetical protein
LINLYIPRLHGWEHPIFANCLSQKGRLLLKLAAWLNKRPNKEPQALLIGINPDELLK